MKDFLHVKKKKEKKERQNLVRYFDLDRTQTVHYFDLETEL